MEDISEDLNQWLEYNDKNTKTITDTGIVYYLAPIRRLNEVKIFHKNHIY